MSSVVTARAPTHLLCTKEACEVQVTWSDSSLPSSSPSHRCVTCRCDYSRPRARRSSWLRKTKRHQSPAVCRGVTVALMPRSWRESGLVLCPAAGRRQRRSNVQVGRLNGETQGRTLDKARDTRLHKNTTHPALTLIQNQEDLKQMKIYHLNTTSTGKQEVLHILDKAAKKKHNWVFTNQLWLQSSSKLEEKDVFNLLSKAHGSTSECLCH